MKFWSPVNDSFFTKKQKNCRYWIGRVACGIGWLLGWVTRKNMGKIFGFVWFVKKTITNKTKISFLTPNIVRNKLVESCMCWYTLCTYSFLKIVNTLFGKKIPFTKTFCKKQVSGAENPRNVYSFNELTAKNAAFETLWTKIVLQMGMTIFYVAMINEN